MAFTYYERVCTRGSGVSCEALLPLPPRVSRDQTSMKPGAKEVPSPWPPWPPIGGPSDQYPDQGYILQLTWVRFRGAAQSKAGWTATSRPTIHRRQRAAHAQPLSIVRRNVIAMKALGGSVAIAIVTIAARRSV